MTFDLLAATPLAALLAGVAGSGHCLAMCGGVAGALAMRGEAAAGSRAPARALTALAYNGARITSYTVAGAAAGGGGQALLGSVDVAALAIGMRLLAAAVIVAAAGRLLFGWRLLDPLEAAGARLWRRVMPWVGSRGKRPGLRGALALGLAWGWLPCGLSYSMLLLAATTGSAATGALVLAAFGLGTLPAMTSATFAFDRVARFFARRGSARAVAGALLLGFGAWTAVNALQHAGGSHVHQHAAAVQEMPATGGAEPTPGAEPHAQHRPPP